MVMGFSISASAVTVDEFTDKAEIRPGYVAAVDLLTELSIINGMTATTFEPAGTLTRAQYAKMLYVIFNRGVDDQATLYAGLQHNFADVPDGAWFDGYVSWMFGRGWVSGRNAEGTVFDPNGPVTGFEALKMSLVALGYDEDIEKFANDAMWANNVMNRAQDAGLLNGIYSEDVLNTYIRRDVSAHILHNTLFADLIQYNQQFIPMRAEKRVPYQSLAIQYYNLSVLTGEAVANTWANLTGVSIASGMKSAFRIRSVDGDILRTQTGLQAIIPLQFSQDIPLEVLGHEVSIYAHTKVYPTTGVDGQWDYIYGTPKKTARSTEDIEWSNADRNAAEGAAGTADTVGEIQSYITHADELNKPNGADIINSDRIFVDYKAFVAGSEVTVGSPIAFIDNNADGAYDWARARNLVYSKVTAVGSDADAEVTATKGDLGNGNGGFDNGRSLNGVKKAEIYGGEDLKVDDRVLVYGIDGKFGVEVVAPSKGTLTQSREGGSIARISDKDYKQSALVSRVSNIADVLDGINFNVERDYYFHAARDQILEGPGGAPDTSKWALVLDSYWAGGILTGAADARVRLLFDDNQKGNYSLSAVKDANGKAYSLSNGDGAYESKIKLANDGHASPHLVAERFPRGVDDSSGSGDVSTQVLAGEFAYIFKATVSADGTSVELQNPGVEYATASGAADGANSATGLTYSKGAAAFSGTITSPVTNMSRLMDSSVVFGVDLTDVEAGGVAEAAAAFKGRTIDTFPAALNAATSGRTTYASVFHDPAFIDRPNTYQKPVVAMALIADNVPSIAKVAGNFAYALEVDIVQRNEAGNFYGGMIMFDGTEVKHYTGADKIRSETPWTNSKIHGAEDDLVANNFGVTNGDGFQYATNADGKLSSLVTYKRLDGSAGKEFNTATIDPGAGDAYLGWATVPGSSMTLLYPLADADIKAIDEAAVKEILFNGDTKFYEISKIDGLNSEVRSISGIPSYVHKNNAVKTLFLTEVNSDNVEIAHTVYVITAERTKEVAILRGETGGGGSTSVSLTAEWLSTGPDTARVFLPDNYTGDPVYILGWTSAAGLTKAVLDADYITDDPTGFTAIAPLNREVKENTDDGPPAAITGLVPDWTPDSGTTWVKYQVGSTVTWMQVADKTTDSAKARASKVVHANVGDDLAGRWNASALKLTGLSKYATLDTITFPAAITVGSTTTVTVALEGIPSPVGLEASDITANVVTINTDSTANVSYKGKFIATYTLAIGGTFTVTVEIDTQTADAAAVATAKSVAAEAEGLTGTAQWSGSNNVLVGLTSDITGKGITLTFSDTDVTLSASLDNAGGMSALSTMSGGELTIADTTGATVSYDGTEIIVTFRAGGETDTVVVTVDSLTADQDVVDEDANAAPTFTGDLAGTAGTMNIDNATWTNTLTITTGGGGTIVFSEDAGSTAVATETSGDSGSQLAATGETVTATGLDDTDDALYSVEFSLAGASRTVEWTINTDALSI
jgi:hypothetical protein